MTRTLLFGFLMILLTLPSLPACSTQTAADDIHFNMTSLDMMPPEVQSAPASVQEAYQFASANPDVMEDIPCYCGCGSIGHTSNYACYVADVDNQGRIRFDNHALGCSICVDITQDVLRMMREGRTQQEARAYIDATYSKYGPSNIP
jgi:hypothetical protein